MYVKEVKKNAYRYYPEKIPEGLICMSQKGGELDGLDGDSWTHYRKITWHDTKGGEENGTRSYAADFAGGVRKWNTTMGDGLAAKPGRFFLRRIFARLVYKWYNSYRNSVCLETPK